jgi:hypothetical protein
LAFCYSLDYFAKLNVRSTQKEIDVHCFRTLQGIGGHLRKTAIAGNDVSSKRTVAEQLNRSQDHYCQNTKGGFITYGKTGNKTR